MKPSTTKSTAVKATCESAAVKTSARAGSSARGIRSDDTAMIEPAKGTRMEARRCTIEGVADARMAEVGTTSSGAAEAGMSGRCGPAISLTMIVKTPAVMEETRAA